MKKGCKGYLQRTLKYTSVHAPDCNVYNGLKGGAIGQLKDFPSPKKNCSLTGHAHRSYDLMYL